MLHAQARRKQGDPFWSFFRSFSSPYFSLLGWVGAQSAPFGVCRRRTHTSTSVGGFPLGSPQNQTVMPSAILGATSPVSIPPCPTASPSLFTTDTSAIASECNKHWSGIFDKKEVNLSEMSSFFCDVKGKFSHTLDVLLPKKEIVEQALLRSRDSATGPDGAPYSAWKAIPGITIALVLALIHLIFNTDKEIDQTLLLAFMVFLPTQWISTQWT